MSDIKIIHKSYTITFREDTEEWSCYELSIDGSRSLKAVKERIDDITRADRRLSIEAYHKEKGRFGNEFGIVRLTLLCPPNDSRYDPDKENGQITRCWIEPDTKDGKKIKVKIANLIPLSAKPEIMAAQRLDLIATEAIAAAEAAWATIPVYDVDTLMLANREAKAAKEPAK